MPIQGTAADIVKIAMIRLYDRLMREGSRARMLLQVHDELLLEVPRDELDATRARSCARRWKARSSWTCRSPST